MDQTARELTDSKALYRRIDHLIEKVGAAHMVEEMVNRALELFVEDPAVPIQGVRVWERRSGRYVLYFQSVTEEKVPLGYELHADHPVLLELLRRKAILMTPDDPGYDHPLEQRLGVTHFAAVTVGPGHRFIISFDLAWDEFSDREEFMFFLDIVRQLIDSRLTAEHYEDMLGEVRRIQASTLPEQMPAFSGYDVYGISVPAEGEQVGGDVFGFVNQHDESVLGFFVGDASGHGLPAALMARDLHTALLMGAMSELMMSRLVARINGILCRITPTGKYMSLFYGEIDAQHQLVYCSAGHPALALSGDEFVVLRQGGPILGVKEDARYSRGVHTLERGDILCLITDGVTETFGQGGQLFGPQRVRDCLLRHRHRSAREIVEGLLAEVGKFGNQREEDDRTILVVKRNEAPA
jgi:sigma-B regulation protein RsbU (phosphoserine phosphatase)